MQISEELEYLKEANKNKNIKSEEEIINEYKKNRKRILVYLFIMTLTINLLMLFIIILIYSNNEKIEYINHKYNYNITPIDPNVPKRKIYVKYMDFWPAFKIEEFDIHDILNKRYEVILSENPDYVFFGNFWKNNYGLENKIDCIKIFLSIIFLIAIMQLDCIILTKEIAIVENLPILLS